MAEPGVRLVGVSKTFGTGEGAVTALREVTLDVSPGELVALVGRSGSGKTTLLNCIGGLDQVSAGRIEVGGREVTTMSESALVTLRREVVAYVFQTFGLISVLSAAENVGLPLRLGRMHAVEREERVDRLLDLVGLAAHVHQRPGELSGGQQQRVAVARALANRPQVLLADEPTGQLDAETGRQIMALLQTVVRAEGMTAIISTHDPALLDVADRVVRLADGHLVQG
jgi:putative ABC transport system ATP-binding protein